jgi:type IV secretory pathway TrbL component
MGGLAAAGSIMGGVGGLTSLFGGLSGDADVAKTGATIGMAGSALGTVGTAFDERKAKKEMEGTMPVAENPTEEEMDTSQTPVSDMQQGAPELQLTDEQRAMYQQRNNELYGTFRDGINTNGARGLMAKYGCYMKPGRKANGRAK